MRKEVKIGLFAFVMLILLFWGINFLKGKNIFTSAHTYYTTFDNVEGLNVSGDVMFRGIKVGTVTGIEFDPQAPDAIRVEFTVGRKYPLPNDSHVTTSAPIIGNKTLIVEYGHSPEMYRSGDRIPSVSKQPLLGQLTDGFEPVKEQLMETVNGLNRTLGRLDALLSEENVESISGILSNTQSLTAKLQVSGENINAITGNLKDNSQNINRILANVGEFSDSLRAIRLASAVDNLNETMASLNGIVSKVNEGDGSLARLLNDKALYAELQSSAENLSLLLEDLKSNPKRYVHFSLFGRKDK